jgi:hypothetical protein
MPVTINKNSGATTYSIRNFTSLRLNGITPLDIISDIAGDETDTMLLKFFGPQMTIDVSWVITDESSSVVSGTGGSVTTAVGQTKYLYDTLWSKGSTSDTDEYELELDFGGGVTMSRTGHVTNIDVSMTSNEPLTFSGTIRFDVGHNPLS